MSQPHVANTSKYEGKRGNVSPRMWFRGGELYHMTTELALYTYVKGTICEVEYQYSTYED